MTVATTALSTLKISAAAPATFDVAGYEALTFTIIGEITDYGEVGREYTEVSHNPVDNRATQVLKGSYKEGSMNLTMALDNSDAGQGILRAAVASDSAYSFELTIQDGSTYYFQARAMSFKINLGSVDSVTSATCSLSLTSTKTGIGIIEA